MSTIPPFHNPNNLTASQYGANKGWRLLRIGEVEPDDSEHYSDLTNLWARSNGHQIVCDDFYARRTRAPDPFAMADEWVKRSEREPTEADLPVMFGGFYGIEATAWTQLFCANLLMTSKSWTHWLPMNKIPAPPARELTQTEKDNLAFTARRLEMNSVMPRNIWHAAIAYERARTGK